MSISKGRGISGIAGVQSHQEADKPRRSKPFQVVTSRGYVCRVADPAEGVAVLLAMLEAGELPPVKVSVVERRGRWEVSLVSGSKPGRMAWLRLCDSEAEAQDVAASMVRYCGDLWRQSFDDYLRGAWAFFT